LEAFSTRAITTRTRYNGFDRVIEKIVDTAGLNLTTTYRYDANGNLGAVMDPEGGDLDEEHTYDGLGRRVLTISPLGGVQKFFYDGDGNQVKTVDRRGVVMEFEFDNLNRQVKRTLTESISKSGARTDVYRLVYDDAANTTPPPRGTPRDARRRSIATGIAASTPTTV